MENNIGKREGDGSTGLRRYGFIAKIAVLCAFFLVILALNLAPAIAQVQTHNISEIVFADADLNLGSFGIVANLITATTMHISTKVGIGTTQPNATLHVAGDINVTAGHDICIDGGGNCLGSISSGAIFVGKTTSSYNANFSAYGAAAGELGYYAANAICDGEFTGSHICTGHEIAYTIATQDVSLIPDWTLKAWIAMGSSKYAGVGVRFVNDCHGFMDDGSAGDAYGNWWYFNDTTGGVGETGTCDSELPIACCR